MRVPNARIAASSTQLSASSPILICASLCHLLSRIGKRNQKVRTPQMSVILFFWFACINAKHSNAIKKT